MTRSTVTPWALKKARARVEEGAGALLLLVGQELGVGEAGGVVDGDVEVLPADAAVLVHAGMVAGDAMADAVDPAELLGVDVDEFARRCRW